MPEKIEITAYKFSELSPAGQKKALEWATQCSYQDYDSEQLTEFFQEFLAERGFRDSQVYWSLGYCQGDGVAFTGRADVSQLRARQEFADILNRMESIGIDVEQTYIKIYHEGRYYHWNSMKAEVESYWSSEASDEQLCEINVKGKLEDDLRVMVNEYCKTLSREMEKMGYAEIEYKSSDEYLTEMIEANDYLFTACGRRSITL